ncbi:YebG family protein [Rheinheimera sp. WS51]|uniref:YebG family protein n=1 Tax=Rheinheimera sp. WS51 TaxID=3425886 RepID=UPI003D8EE315
MAVIIKYVVERNGAQKMTFTSKAEADAYDKMLDTADELTEFLSASELMTDEQQIDALALYLAQNKDEVLIALGAKKKPTKKAKAPAKITADKAGLAATKDASEDAAAEGVVAEASATTASKSTLKAAAQKVA